MSDVRVVLRQGEIRKLARSDVVVRELLRQARPIESRARAAAPRSPSGSHGRASGYLASQIVLRDGEDSDSAFVDVATTARTPAGFPYGALWELRRPYLRPSLG